jgi:hypothetical protein
MPFSFCTLLLAVIAFNQLSATVFANSIVVDDPSSCGDGEHTAIVYPAPLEIEVGCFTKNNKI